MEDDNQLPESEVGAEGDRENEHRRGNLPDRSPRIRGSRARGMEADRDVDEEGHEAAPVPDEAVEGEIVSGPSGYENPSFSAVVEHSGPSLRSLLFVDTTKFYLARPIAFFAWQRKVLRFNVCKWNQTRRFSVRWQDRSTETPSVLIGSRGYTLP